MTIKKNHYEQLGLFSDCEFEKGCIISIVTGKVTSEPSKTSIQIAKGKHVHVINELQFINHSFSPNIKILGDKIIAIKEIKRGDELVFNYNDSEDELASPFTDANTGQLVAGSKVTSKEKSLA